MIELPRTTREGFPTLWGQGELASYAVAYAAEVGKPAPRPGRTWTWDRLAGFPQPVARLQAGNVWLADELIPWIQTRIRTQPEDLHNTAKIPDDVRAQILAAKDDGQSLRAVAARYGVGHMTVRRIWNETQFHTEKT